MIKQEFTICISNRPPFTLTKDANTNNYVKTKGSGGLAAGLCGLPDTLFVGVIPKSGKNIPQQICLEHGLFPIYIPEEEYKIYYNCVSNSILWPWLHQQEFSISSLVSLEQNFLIYKKVTKTISSELTSFINSSEFLTFISQKLNTPNPDQIRSRLNIWIHDYQLFLLPHFLNQLNPSLKTAFFLHVPFPSSSWARTFPFAPELVSSLLTVNLIGFHCLEYAKNFWDYAHSLYSYNNSKLTIKTIKLSINDPNLKEYIEKGKVGLYKIPANTLQNNKPIFVGTTPIGINTAPFKTSTRLSITHNLSVKPSNNLNNSNSIFTFLGVERRDTIKGILNKLESFHLLLKKYPSLIGKVQLIQIVVPSRIGVPSTDKLHKQICRTVGRINGEFGDEVYTPVSLINRGISFEKLVHLYKNSNALIVSSTVDGYNLVCAEWIASQCENNPGVLLLSKFTGIHNLVKNGAVSLNPYNISEMSEMLYNGITMDVEQRRKLFKEVEWVGKGNMADVWATAFLSLLDVSLGEIKESEEMDM